MNLPNQSFEVIVCPDRPAITSDNRFYYKQATAKKAGRATSVNSGVNNFHLTKCTHMKTFVDRYQQRKYLSLLCAILALLVIQPIASAFGVGESLFEVLVVFVMAVLVLVLSRERVWRFVAAAVCIAAAILSTASHFLTSSAQNATLTASHAIGALFFVLVAGKIIRSILAAQELSWDMVFGAICGYLLLGVAWGLTYAMLHVANPEAFQFGNDIRLQMEEGDYSRNVFIYYSFVTLTTVGYGDVSALSTTARTLSWVEAVVGQLYLAVLIAGLISALVAKGMNQNQRP